MKIDKFLYKPLFLSLAAGLTFSSCIMDSYEDDPAFPEGVLPKGNYIIGFNINPVNGTRADGDLVNGSDDDKEHAIGNNTSYVLYFNNEETLVEVTPLLTIAHNDPGPYDYIEAEYVSQITVSEDWEVPKLCLVILNGNNYVNSLKDQIGNIKKDEVLAGVQSSTNPFNIGRQGDLFTMTNSIYVEGGNKVDLVTLPVNVIQKPDEPFDPKKAVTVFVERMVSKFTFGYDDPELNGAGVVFSPDPKDEELIVYTGCDDDGIPQFDTKEWKVMVTGWGINALETENNYFKQINVDGNYFSGWQDAARKRTYWSVDPHYDDAVLPYSWQYRRAIDKIIHGKPVQQYLNYYEDLERKGNNKLVNYSYNYFENASKEENFNRIVYTPENTYDYGKIEKYLDNRADVLAGTHLILTAQLLTNIFSKDPSNFEAKTVFRDRASVFYKDSIDCFTSEVIAINNALTSQSTMKFHYYNWNDDNDPENGNIYYVMPKVDPWAENFNLYCGDVKIDYNNAKDYVNRNDQYVFKPSEVKDGDGKVIFDTSNFTIKTSNGSEMPIYRLKDGLQEEDANDEKNFEIVNFDGDAKIDYDNAIQSVIYEWVGAVDHFIDGKMYYFKEARINKDICGTVRNAWYQYSLEDINQIGTSVDDPNQPIVPIKVPVQNRLLIKVKLLDWHNIETEVALD